MATDDFDGTFNTITKLTITPPGGSPAEFNVQGIENLTPPGREHKKDTWTPISGSRAGLEQQVLCSESSSSIQVTVTYEKVRQLQLDEIAGINGCTIVLTTSDGLAISCIGGAEKVSPARMEDSKHNTAEITFAINAGWTQA